MYWQEATKSHLKPLKTFKRVGLVTDLDGTISHFAERPHDALVTPRSLRLLSQLTDLLSLVSVISGRSAADVHGLIDLPGVRIIGNHGLERWVDGAVQVSPAAAAYRPSIEAARDAIAPHREPGMLVEDKGATLSIHYRETTDREAARDRLDRVLRRIAVDCGLKFSTGQFGFEIKPPVAEDKGTALRDLVREYELEAALFIGDDTTDAAALQVARQLRQEQTCYALGIGVVSAGTPALVLESSDLLAAGVAGVEALLAWLVDARMASST